MHTNPGKHTKGQDPSFHSHHTGPRGKEFISGDSARAKSLYKRKRTLFAKVKYSFYTIYLFQINTDVYESSSKS